METSDEKTRNCWLTIQRVCLFGILGIRKIYFLDIHVELFRLWVGKRH
jgi:hypothetical protein